MIIKKNGIEVTVELLNIAVNEGLTEVKIAKKLGISRMSLYRIRKQYGWERTKKKGKNEAS